MAIKRIAPSKLKVGTYNSDQADDISVHDRMAVIAGVYYAVTVSRVYHDG